MRSTFHLLEIGKRGLIAQQAAINTAGHNVTNANTPGYSRQTTRLVAANPIAFPGMQRSQAAGQLGMGVEADSIRRVRDFLLDIEYRNQNTNLSTWSVQQETLSNIEGIFNEPSDSSLSASIAEFWTAWQTLSKNPSDTDLSARMAVQQKAIALTETFNHIYSQLDTLSNNLTSRIDTKVAEANNYIDQVAELTQSIKRIEGLGDNANDMRDKRDLLIDQLSLLGNVNVTETGDVYQVTFGNQVVVDDMTSTPITNAIAGTLTGGEIAGYVTSRDVHVQGYITQLNIMANTLATGKVEVTLPAGTILPPGVNIPNAVMDANNPRKLAVDTKHTVDGLNGLHKLGYTLNEPATTGSDFFVSANGGPITAGNMRLSQNIQSDLKNIGASLRTEMKTNPDGTTSEVVLKGNGGMALLIAGLSERTFSFNPNNSNGAVTDITNFEGYLQSVISKLGTDSSNAIKMVENGTLLVEHADTLRLSISSVSLDEEMSDLIRFQHAYSASSRVVTTIDEMLDKLINGTGIVGRVGGVNCAHNPIYDDQLHDEWSPRQLSQTG
ncbi:flagellar hook-associated protein FlgK [Paenibacillus vortex V453]|uniref:Flagellar hook-associated protein 1 n=2 Tax=Paenibacillus TaxID=44249 RepID=A0A2R9SLF1_9BACL|nr:flagellar hook-associated protein FlgK [Paenibacillus vortex]EFU38189.1 flagellar hook-associated protein FlgK [Paenibacillus vortex V453]